MQTGTVLHQQELGPDVAVLRDYGQTVQDLGYDFIVASDHIVGADPAAYPQLERVFPIDTFLREPLTVFAFLSAVAPRLGFLTSVVILPQRQTVLVAKQAADIDTLLAAVPPSPATDLARLALGRPALGGRGSVGPTRSYSATIPSAAQPCKIFLPRDRATLSLICRRACNAD